MNLPHVTENLGLTILERIAMEIIVAHVIIMKYCNFLN